MPERGGSSRNQASPAQSLEPLSWAAVGHLPDFKLDHDREERQEEAADSKSFLAPQSLSPQPHLGEREEGCGHCAQRTWALSGPSLTLNGRPSSAPPSCPHPDNQSLI